MTNQSRAPRPCFDTCRIGCLSQSRCPVERSPSLRQLAAQEEARREIERREATQSMAAFCARMDDKFTLYKHTKAVIDVLDALSSRQIDRAMVFLGPRFGKPVSVQASVLMGDGGCKLLGDIVVGDTVVTHTGKAQNVESVFEQPKQRSVRIATYGERSIEAALDHPFWTPSGHWVSAGDLSPGQSVSVRSGIGQPLMSDTVKELTPIESLDCRCLTVAIDHTFTANDFIVHNSYLCSERFTAYYLGRVPRAKVMMVAYGSDLAQGFSRKSRDLMMTPEWPFPDCKVNPSHAAIGSWSTTAGGEVTAAGFGGSITGKGSNLLVVDDPIKNPEEANSVMHREKTWEFYGSAVRTRLERNALQLFIMTRWHEDDLAGRILNSEEAKQWHILSLPAINADGSLLWPEGPTLPKTSDGVISERAFASLYMQEPRPSEGSVFRRAFLEHYYDEIPESSNVIQAVDSALGLSDTADFTVVTTLAYDGKDVYIVDVRREQAQFYNLQQIIKAEFAKERNTINKRPSRVYVEEVAAHSGAALIQELRRTTGLPVIGARPQGDKVARAELVTGYFESGRVKVPRKAPWYDLWREELLAFPNGKHDDMVDSVVMGIQKLISRPGVGLIMGALSTVRRHA